MKKFFVLFFSLITIVQITIAQNSLVSNGFGGRLWYKSYNYAVGSYSGYTVCGTDSQLYAWGGNGRKQLGNSTVVGIGVTTPIKVENMTQVMYYSTGYVMGAIKSDNTGWMWGHILVSPIQVINDVFFVDAGIRASCFVKNDGTVWSVGQEVGQAFGNGVTSYSQFTVPIQMHNINNAVRVAVSGNVTAVLLSDGTVYTTGSGECLGTGTALELVPTQVLGLKDIVDIKANTNSMVALDKNGDVWNWGEDNLGLGSTMTASDVPRKITEFKDIVAISGCADGLHCLALDKDKNCYGWGLNYFGSFGVFATEEMSPVLLETDVVEIMAGETFSYIVKSDGELYATGSSQGGSIWMGLTNKRRLGFTKINPRIPTYKLCSPLIHNASSGTDNVTIDGDTSISEIVVLFPNAFSPNNDGINNIFRALIRSNAIIDKYELSIYNRWGQRVFKTNDVYAGWDGKISGAEQPIGTYFYHAIFRTANSGQLTRKGDLTLLR